MEALIALIIGALTAAGVFLMMQRRSFSVVLGLSLLSYAVNMFIFISNRILPNAPPIITEGAASADPLPQALVLTAIVISFGMTALALALAMAGHLHVGDDLIDGQSEGRA